MPHFFFGEWGFFRRRIDVIGALGSAWGSVTLGRADCPQPSFPCRLCRWANLGNSDHHIRESTTLDDAFLCHSWARERLTRKEEDIRKELKAGLTLAEALAKFGHV